MDELEQYLKFANYHEYTLEHILNKKIMITDKHIDAINVFYDMGRLDKFNIITLFEKYGYIFTNNTYILLVTKNGYLLKFISEDNRTDEI